MSETPNKDLNGKQEGAMNRFLSLIGIKKSPVKKVSTAAKPPQTKPEAPKEPKHEPLGSVFAPKPGTRKFKPNPLGND